VLLVANVAVDRAGGPRLSADNDDDTESGSSRTGQLVPLEQHLVAVGDRARDIACRLGLNPSLQATLELAGRAHDLGKADDRFQALLLDGDPLLAEAATVKLAKSGAPYKSWSAHKAALERSGWPEGMRHEAVSGALLERLLESETIGEGVDRELCVHLVVTHHGWARPLSKPTRDREPRPVPGRLPGGERSVEVMSDARLVDWQGPVRFASLCERYGRWGLALLEAILRLADIACSEEGT
jgi:CRISPR-associated endonuclease/helicase Cas3